MIREISGIGRSGRRLNLETARGKDRPFWPDHALPSRKQSEKQGRVDRVFSLDGRLKRPCPARRKTEGLWALLESPREYCCSIAGQRSHKRCALR
jgi:hypothetical protein